MSNRKNIPAEASNIVFVPLGNTTNLFEVRPAIQGVRG